MISNERRLALLERLANSTSAVRQDGSEWVRRGHLSEDQEASRQIAFLLQRATMREATAEQIADAQHVAAIMIGDGSTQPGSENLQRLLREVLERVVEPV